jgi:hypothetical protein
MATMVPDLPSEQPESFADDLAGMGSFFIDPPGAARRVFTKWFWVGPIVLFSIVTIIVGNIMMPIIRHAMEVSPVPPNVTPEQYARGMEIGLKIQRVAMYFAPITTAVLFAVQALILLGMSSIMGVTAKFRWLFNLVAGCGLIQLLASIATIVILRARGEVSTMAELRPALGLDIFLPGGANKVLTALLGYFSVFEIWWVVMAVLVFSAAFRVSKGKAFTVVLPLILLSLVFRVVGAVFQR